MIPAGRINPMVPLVVVLLLDVVVGSLAAAPAFVPPPPRRSNQHAGRATANHHAAASSAGADHPLDKLFANATAWQPLRKKLDAVPVFCVAEAQGNPVAYTVQQYEGDSKNADNDPLLPVFYCQVSQAQQALEDIKKNPPPEVSAQMMQDMDLIPFPLGQALELQRQGEAIVVPSATSLQDVGARSSAAAAFIARDIPLFACLQIMQQDKNDDDNTSDKPPVLPLFMAKQDLLRQLDLLVTDKNKDLEVLTLSLTRAMELLATESADAFQLIPSTETIEYIEEYLANN